MDKTQQLEVMGRECLAAWQGKMFALRGQSALPGADLTHALPQLRGWIGELSQAYGRWLSITTDNAALLDPMLPWHWLDMAAETLDIAENAGGELPILRSPKPHFLQPQRQPSASPTDLPEKLSAKSTVAQPSALSGESPTSKSSEIEGKADSGNANATPNLQQPSKEAEEKGKTAESRNASPTDARNSSPAEAQKVNFPEENPKGKTQSPKDKENWLLQDGKGQSGKNEASSEPEKQVIFRGLQDFASFIQSPMPPAQFRDEEKGKKQVFEDSEVFESRGESLNMTEAWENTSLPPQDSHETSAQYGTESHPFALENDADFQKLQHKPGKLIAPATRLQPELPNMGLSEALLPDSFSQATEPQVFQSMDLNSPEQESHPGEMEMEGKPSLLEKVGLQPQYPQSFPSQQQNLASPSLTSLGEALAHLVQAQGKPEPATLLRQPGKDKRPAHYPAHHKAMQPAAPAIPLQSPQALSQPPSQPLQAASTASEPSESTAVVAPIAWANTLPTPQEPTPELMESIMEAMSEQLQRDFERYYGG